MLSRKLSFLIVGVLLMLGIARPADAEEHSPGVGVTSPLWAAEQHSRVDNLQRGGAAARRLTVEAQSRGGREPIVIVPREASPRILSDPKLLASVIRREDKPTIKIDFDPDHTGHVIYSDSGTIHVIDVTVDGVIGRHDAENLASVVYDNANGTPYSLNLNAGDHSVRILFKDGTERMLADSQIRILPSSQTERDLRHAKRNVAER